MTFRPVPLAWDKKVGTRIGKLEYVGGWSLTSNDSTIAAGWGVDSTVNDDTRWGWRCATAHAWKPPQS